MQRSVSVLVLCASLTVSLVASARTGKDGSLLDPPEVVALHMAEATAQRERLAKLRTSDSWAPDLGPSAIDVLHYSLDVHLDVEREVLSGAVEVELEAAGDPLDTVALDADQGLRVLSVILLEDRRFADDGLQVLAFDHQDDRLSIHLPRTLSSGERIRLQITYGGRAGSFGGGVNWDRTSSGSPVIHTFAEPFGSRLWWPCNDRPDDKATVDLAVTAPSQLVVASNGLQTEVEEVGDGRTTTRWSSRYPVSTYLVVMNASDYELSELTYQAGDGSTMPVVLYAYPQLADEAELDLAVTPAMIAVLAQRFGEYPFVEEKYGNCITPFGGGMEHQTLTTISQWAIGGDGIDWLNVHELGHQWWGDWVTNEDWRELWLNEGFATYSELVWAEHEDPELLASAIEDMDWSGFFVGAVYDNPVPFSSTVYEKGAWVLRMLRHVLGDETFFSAIGAYRQAHAAGNATSESLRAVLEDASGQDLEWYFEQWVYGSNRPRYQYSWSEVEGPAVRLTVTQEHSNAPLFRMPMDVRVTTTAGDETAVVWLEAEAEQTLDIPVTASPTAVILDPDHRVLCELSEATAPDLDMGPDYPGPFNAGQVVSGTAATITVPLNNTGGSDLVISSIAAWSGDRFAVVSPVQFPVTIGAGDSRELEISYAASGSGRSSDWVLVTSNDPSRGGVAYLRVEGTGLGSEGPMLTAPPIALLGEAAVGGATEGLMEIGNRGGQVLYISAITATGDFSVVSSPPSTLAPGTSAFLTVRFSPTESGPKTGILMISSDDPLWPERSVPMRGTGVAAPHVEIDPPAVLFGVVSDDAVAVVTVTNTGQIDLELAEVAVEAPFSVYSSGDWPTSLEPGQHIELEVGLAGAPSGTAEGTLRILTDDPTLPMAQVPIKGYIADSAVVESAYPAVASAEGLGGARWRSTAILLNPGLGDIVTDVRFMPPGGPSSGSPGVTISIPPGHQRVLSDVVGRTGNHGTGGLDLTTSGAGLVATSRTYAGDDSGTYGQLVPAVPDQDALVGGETYLLAGLVANGGFHTNFGVLNLGEDSISVDFDVHDAEGRPLGTVHLSAAGNGFAQRTSALSTLTGDEIRGGFASVSCANSAARYLAYASSVDDNSHDPTLVSPQVLGRPVSLDAVIPVVASTSGIGGTLWRSHATVVNTGAGDAAVELEFYPRDGGEVTSVTLGVGPGRALFLADVVGETFAATGSGWVSVTSEATGVHVASRTFNNDPAGTYGQNVPAVDADDLFGAGDTVVLAGLSSIGGFRTNVGIASRSAGETRFVLRANRDDGELIGELALTVPAAALLQVERVLGDGFGYSGSAWITLVSDDAQAEFAAYASVVDGSTGDSTFVPGVEIGAGSQR